MRLHNNVLLASLMLFLVACGDDQNGSTSDSTTTPGMTTTDMTTTDMTTTDMTTTGMTTTDMTTTDMTTGEPTTEPTTTEPTTTGPTSEDTGATTSEATATVGPSWAADVWPVLDPPVGCDCHTPGAGNLMMGDIDTAYMNLVGVMAVQAPLARVMAGNAEESYLWHKINGTQASVGGSGSDMPLGAAALPQATLDLIKEWIDGGAQP